MSTFVRAAPESMHANTDPNELMIDKAISSQHTILQQKAILQHLKQSISVDRLNKPPAAWFYVGPESAISDTPTPIAPWGKPLMVYRAGEDIIVQSRHCVHMNTDLTKARLQQEKISCPMHGWKFDAQGKVAEIPGGDAGTCKLHLPTYPVFCVGGHVFTHKRAISRTRAEKTPPFPAFADKAWNTFHLEKGIDFYSDAPWYLITANGFDICHFEFVHGRKPVTPSELIIHDPHHCGIEHRYLNVSQTWFDRLLRKIYGAEMQLAFDVFDGNTILSCTKMRGRTNYMCANVQPISETTSKITIIPLTPISVYQKQNAIVRLLAQWVRRQAIRLFFNAELRSIRNVRLNPKRLMASDNVLIRYFHWLSNEMHRSHKEDSTP